MTGNLTHTTAGIEVAPLPVAPVVGGPPVLSGEDVAYVVEDTALGPMLFAARSDGALVASTYLLHDAEDAVLDRLARAVSPKVLRRPAALDGVRREVDEYLAGRRREFDVVVDPVLAGPFQRTVLAALPRSARYGERISYGALAAALGKPSAARAVGTALGANPLCVVLPCHRVVGASGALTGYAGGLEAKRRLLDLEAGG